MISKFAIISILFAIYFSKEVKPYSTGYKLTIEVQGVEGLKGNFMIALYTKKNEFASKKDTYRNKIQTASNRQIVFENLPGDTYGFAIFLDENKNGVIDKNFFGVPTELYGFSNNARETLSAPSFKSASFEVKSDKKVAVTLK